MRTLVEDNRTWTITGADRRRLMEMVESLRASLPAGGEPYGSYLRMLEGQVTRMETVTPAGVPRDVVTLNSRVLVRHLDTGRCEALTVVPHADADGLGGEVSVLWALGAALLGSRAGEVAEWQPRRGPRRRLRVERILYQPEAAGRFDL